MELQDVIRGAGTCRYYTDEEVTDEQLHELFDAARFAPQGGNRQPVRWVVVRDPDKKAQLKEWYLGPWKAYMAGIDSGEIEVTSAKARQVVEDADHFAEHLDEIPVLVVVCGVLADIHPTDTELDRFGIVGGGSIYPAVQNLLLTAREMGLGASITTLLCHFEPQVMELLDIPEGVGTAAVLGIGHPAKNLPTKLTRNPVSSSVFLDSWDNPMFDDEE